MEPPQLFSYQDVVEGVLYERDYTITSEVYEGFLRVFGDRSQLHVDSVYAKACAFTDVLMHGAILNGFISNFVGMVFPAAKPWNSPWTFVTCDQPILATQCDCWGRSHRNSMPSMSLFFTSRFLTRPVAVRLQVDRCR